MNRIAELIEMEDPEAEEGETRAGGGEQSRKRWKLDKKETFHDFHGANAEQYVSTWKATLRRCKEEKKFISTRQKLSTAHNRVREGLTCPRRPLSGVAPICHAKVHVFPHFKNVLLMHLVSFLGFKNSPKRNAILRIIEALNSSEEQRQRVRRVAADQCDDDPRSEERRLGAPALLVEISPARGQQKKGQQDKQKRGDPEHGRGQELGGDAVHRVRNGGCRKARPCCWVVPDTGYMAEALAQLKGWGFLLFFFFPYVHNSASQSQPQPLVS